MTIRPWIAATILLVFAGPAPADDPPAKPLNKPAADTPTTTITIYPSVTPRWGTRAIWENYGVDGSGRFRPLVVRSPFSTSFYLYNGLEYPWTTTRPLDYMPYAID